MILLSALLASLSGLVAGEREPVRAPAQVQASAFVSTVQAETAAVAQVRQRAIAVRIAQPERRASDQSFSALQPRLRTRLSLKQSWLN